MDDLFFKTRGELSSIGLYFVDSSPLNRVNQTRPKNPQDSLLLLYLDLAFLELLYVIPNGVINAEFVVNHDSVKIFEIYNAVRNKILTVHNSAKFDCLWG